MNEEKMTIGTYLRQEREKKNISLEAIARATKITLKNLEALERDELHLLPPPVFVRGFLRAYAHHLGLDAQKIIEMYEAQIKPVDLSPRIKKPAPEKKFSLSPKILLTIISISLVIILIFYLSNSPPPHSPPATQFSPETKTKAPLTEPPLSQTSPPEGKEGEPVLPAPSLTTASEKPPGFVPAEKKKERRHVLKVRAIEKTWLRIKADDEKEIEALLQPQELATWTARRQFKITIGNAGGIEVSFNGIRQGRLGELGQVVHLILPAEIKKKEVDEKKD